MDWISTTTGCFAVSNAVTKTALDLNRFVRDVRESRADLASLSAELHALDGVLDLLKDDAASAAFPTDLALQTPAIVAGSGALVAELGVILGGGDRDSSSEKRSRWLLMRQHIAESRAVLEVYRLTLGLGLDLVALTPIANANAKDLARMLAEIGHLRTRVRSDIVDEDAIFLLQTYLNVLQRHAQSAATEADADHEPEPTRESQAGSGSESENEVETQADGNSAVEEEVDAAAGPEPSFARDEAAASPIGKAPDSAVEMMDDEGENDATPSPLQQSESQSQSQSNNSLQTPQLPTASSSAYSLPPPQRSASPPLPPPPPPPRGRINGPALLPSCEINDLMDELREELPSRPPTPPPKAVARGSSALGFYGGGPPSNGSSSPASVRPVPNMLTAPPPRAPPPQMSLQLRPLLPMAAPAGQLSHSISYSNMARPPANNNSNNGNTSTPPQASSNQGARFGRFLRHIRSASATSPAELDRRPATATGIAAVSAFAPTPLANIPSNTSNTSQSASSHSNGSNGSSGNLAVADRRASRRFSATFRSPWAVTTMIQAGDNTTDNRNSRVASKQKKKKGSDKTDNEPDAVFGVSLRKSILMAGSSARTHHTGSHGASRREFPLCIFKCYGFIRSNNGLDTPDIFGGGVPGLSDDGADLASSLDVVNLDRVRALREHFSTPPLYGADLDDAKLASAIVIESGSGAVLSHRGYSRHDAAALILQYLEQLPKPLVPEVMARRWVTLSRQATLPGSYAKRLDQCIDFWEEALGGIHGPARSLLKLLLNLWGDIADAAERNDMTAERLAARVLRPLMHLDGGRHETDYMLSLAFIIRKRSEYALLLRGGGRKSNAAFEA
ncbi:hypothetical protein SCUCBS95973_009247 [Sporothrix curviconia]|uniref:Rho-GAP domain-containing protein n=1 Tax=Sporothrix curviconia TaxID=1260050 RepID=A0ABP0CWN8_9PEZI